MTDLRTAILRVLAERDGLTTSELRATLPRDPYDTLRALRGDCLVTSRPTRAAGIGWGRSPVAWTLTDAGRVAVRAGDAALIASAPDLARSVERHAERADRAEAQVVALAEQRDRLQRQIDESQAGADLLRLAEALGSPGAHPDAMVAAIAELRAELRAWAARVAGWAVHAEALESARARLARVLAVERRDAAHAPPGWEPRGADMWVRGTSPGRPVIQRWHRDGQPTAWHRRGEIGDHRWPTALEAMEAIDAEGVTRG